MGDIRRHKEQRRQGSNPSNANIEPDQPPNARHWHDQQDHHHRSQQTEASSYEENPEGTEAGDLCFSGPDTRAGGDKQSLPHIGDVSKGTQKSRGQW